jgi:hypothetical protein
MKYSKREVNRLHRIKAKKAKAKEVAAAKTSKTK